MSERESVRVFISSPSDVRPERAIAERVVQRLDREFAYHLRVEALMWEREPLLATRHFQDLITPPRETDIVVVILWSRLGVPLPQDRYRGPISGGEVTGTEWEFEDALAGYRLRQLPDLLLYRKRAAITVELGDRDAVEARQQQAELVERFISRWTRDESGRSFTAASWEFAEATQFEELLETHLRALLERRIGADAAGAPSTIRWHRGSPYRGLESFEPEHEQIFFGRARARNELRELLARRAAGGTAFVMVIGASGSGKSSLVKAGLIADLRVPGMVDRVGLCRWAVMRPCTDSQPGRPLDALAHSLLAHTALPELAELRYTGERLAALLRESPTQIAIAMEQALSAAGRAAGLTTEAQARLVVVVDQLEEIFTGEGIAQSDREAFIAALEALARCGCVWLIATLRSDFFDRVETLPRLARLSEGDGRYLLTPPDAGELAQIIRQPAREAGLRFESDARSGKSLDERIAEEAAQEPSALPLLEYLLEQLWQRRTENGQLAFRAHDELGGLQGAIGRRAEEIFLAQSPEVQAALPAVLRSLVTVGQGSKGIASARAASGALLSADPACARLVEQMLAPSARLLVAAGDGSGSTYRVAHEALLHHWPRARDQLAEDRRDLQLRARLEDAASRWQESAPRERDTLLLGPGLPLSEALDLDLRRGPELEPSLRQFVAASARRQSRRRTALLGGLAAAALALGIAVVLGVNLTRDYASYRQAREVDARRADIRGTIVANATCRGCESNDGEAGHGLYTEHLLKHLADANQSILTVLERTHRDVLAQASQRYPDLRQIPILETSLTGDLFLHDAVAGRTKLALVVGADKYWNTQIALKNAVNDARAVGAVLEKAGFEVTFLQDPTHDQFLQAVEKLSSRMLEISASRSAGRAAPATDNRKLSRGIRIDKSRDAAPPAATPAEPKAAAPASPSTPPAAPAPAKPRPVPALENGLAFVYVAGHGLQLPSGGYFAPVDVKSETARDVERTSVSLEQLSQALERAAAMSVMVLDISRANPFQAR